MSLCMRSFIQILSKTFYKSIKSIPVETDSGIFDHLTQRMQHKVLFPEAVLRMMLLFFNVVINFFLLFYYVSITQLLSALRSYQSFLALRIALCLYWICISMRPFFIRFLIYLPKGFGLSQFCLDFRTSFTCLTSIYSLPLSI